MTDDPVAVLERELVEAARRRAAGGSGARRVGRITRGLATAAVLIVAVVIAGGAVILLGGHKPTASPAAAEPGRQQLIDLLGVVRRPQTPPDLHSPAIAALLATYNPNRAPWDRFGRPDLPLVRRATVTPWGQSVFLVPVKPAADRRQEGLLLMLGHHSYLDCCATTADLATWGDFNNAGQATGPTPRGVAATHFLAVVPDGVAKVELQLPWWPPTSKAGVPVSPHYRYVAAPVHSNVAAIEFRGQCCGEPPVMFWLGADGNAVRRIGDLAGNYRSVALSPPGPETAASRAAEQDPSTPNRVWVAPPTGGRRTRFIVHFRVLLNAADYFYSVSGPCQTGFGTVGHPDDSRGAIWSDGIEPIAGKSWCTGTYRVSVTVNDLGPFGTLKHPAQPFGAATFTVR